MSQTLDQKIKLHSHYFAYVNGELILANPVKNLSKDPSRYDCYCYALEYEYNNSGSAYLKKMNSNFYNFRFSKGDLLEFTQLPNNDKKLALEKLRTQSITLYGV